jgi:ABC-2 type transport system ATP-binding protein
MSAIRTTDLRKAYGQVRALDGLTLNVEPGAIYGFLGPNGAGKTTTLRLLTGLAKPDSGEAWVGGVNIKDHQQLPRLIGYLPEEPSFYNWMTPSEYLNFVGRVFDLPSNQLKNRVTELLENVGLATVKNRRIGGFSRGMRQRLGLAQALLNQPDVLLLDEPVSALDPAGRKEVLGLIQNLQGKCTVFMSTHILADVERVCNTIGILNFGKLVVEARREVLLARYTLPAFELECEPSAENQFQTWVEGLRQQRWFESMVLNGSTARLVVKDVDSARQSLLTLAAQAEIPFRRYEIVTPSLEDVFLRLVSTAEVV